MFSSFANLRHLPEIRRFALALLTVTVSVACSSDYGTGTASRVVTSVDVSLASSEIEEGQPDTAMAAALDQYGAPIDAGPVTWSSTFPEVAVVQPTTGLMLAIASGTAQITATIAGKVGRRTVTVSPPPILVNEVNPNGDLPAGGWVELFNPTARAVDLTGWTISNSDVSNWFTFPAGVIIESGGYVAVNEQTLPAGLNATDAVHVFNKFGVQSDGYSWTGNAPGTSYGRCPDGIGPLVTTLAPTRKAANACP
jgi:hypothetical protein